MTPGEDVVDFLNVNGLDEYLINGAYIRGLLIPAGTYVISRIWKNNRLWICTEGRFRYSTPYQSEIFHSPKVVLAPYGTACKVTAITDTKLFAITGTQAKTLDEVETDVLIPKEEKQCHLDM